jgi:hypothetical protein
LKCRICCCWEQGPGVAPLADPLHVTWRALEAGDADAAENARYLFGGGVLLVLFGFMFAAALSQRRAWREDQVR